MKVLLMWEHAKALAKEFKRAGHDVTLIKDESSFGPDERFDVVWISPPCSGLSKAGAWKHWDIEEDVRYTPMTAEAKRTTKLLKDAVDFVKKCGAKVWYIELPMGLARKFSFMKALPRKNTTLCQYGLEFRKETDIWTNAKGEFLESCDPGDGCHKPQPRGVKKSGKNAGINTKWADKRAVLPLEFCKAVVTMSEKTIGRGELMSVNLSPDEVVRWHESIVSELARRGLSDHDTPLGNDNKSNYQQPAQSGVVSGPEVTLQEVLGYFGEAKIGKGLVMLTGGIVNNGKSVNDIDILIRMEKDDPLSVPIQFRILRMFPEHLRDRIQFIFSDSGGQPFTSHIPLYDVDMKLQSPLKKVEMSRKELEESVQRRSLPPSRDGKCPPGYKLKDGKCVWMEEASEGGEVEELENKEVDLQSVRWPKEEEAHPFVMQIHFRGESAHHDFRAKTNGELEGWSVFSQPAGQVNEDVSNEAQAQAIIAKVDWKWPKEEVHAEARPKTVQPAEWLKVSGHFDPGQIGAGKDVAGFMQIVDQGNVEFGARKTWFYEYFLHGAKTKGRLVFRYIPRQRSTSIAAAEELALWDWNWVKFTRDMSEKKELSEVPKTLMEYYNKHKGVNSAYQVMRYAKKNGLTELAETFEQRFMEHQKRGQSFTYSEELLEEQISEADTSDLRDVYMRIFDVMDNKGQKVLQDDLAVFIDVLEDELLGRGALQDRRSAGYWTTWLAKSETPYVLTRAAVNEEWIPPYGVSALPKEVRDKVPEKYQYWKFSSRQQRLKVRDELRKAKDVKLHIRNSYDENHHVVEHEGTTYLATTLSKPESEDITFADVEVMCKVDLSEHEYVLLHHFWKGQQVVRVGPTTQHWDLFIGDNMWVLDTDPLKSASNASRRRPYSKGFQERGASGPEFIEPGTPGNPTKSTAAWVTRVDKGSVHMLEDDAHFKKFNLSGGKLKGTFVLKQEEPTVNLWRFGKDHGSKALSKGNVVKQYITMSTGKSYERDGKLYVPGDALSYGVWNGDFYPPEVIADRPERLKSKATSIVSHRNRNNYGSVVELNFDESTSTIHIVGEFEGEEAIERIKQGDLIGYSVEVTVEVDEDRHIVKKILDYDRVVLVPDPACEVCTVDGVCN